MRIILAISFFLAGTLSLNTVSFAKEGNENLLTPGQLREAVDGQVACLDLQAGNQCHGGVVFFEDITDTHLRTREMATFRLSRLVVGRVADAARQMPSYPEFGDMFRQIDELSRENDLNYLRMVDTRDATFDPATGAWCEGPASSIDGLTFYLTISHAPTVDDALPLSAELTQQMRRFLTTVFNDEGVRNLSADNSDWQTWMDVQLGVIELCALRYGRIEAGVPVMTSERFMSRDGTRLRSLDSSVSMIPPSEVVLVVR